MSVFITFLIVVLVLFTLCVIFYILRLRSSKNNVMNDFFDGKLFKYTISILTIFITLLFCYSICFYIEKTSPEISPLHYIDTIYLNISTSLFGFSIIIFIFSLSHKNKLLVKLDYPSRRKSRKGTIKLGKVVFGDRIKHSFKLSMKDLEKHMFICGSTGTGKSNFLQNFLLNFKNKHQIPFLLAEFKGEYQFLQQILGDVLVIKPGENFSINIFDPEGANPQIHAERIFQIFQSGGMLEGIDYSPQMERVFVDILNDVCVMEENRNWKGFYKVSEKYLAENRDNITSFRLSVLGVQNRIRRFSLGTLKNIFIKKSEINIKELFEHDVILDLSSIIRLGGEKEDALFFLNMILKYLWDRNISRGSKNYQGIKHITIIEDAQYFAPQSISNRTKLTSYLEDIALLLRGTGECLISLATQPKISVELLANCGVLVAFQNHMQKDLMQELLNIKEGQKEYLAMLKKGECIIRIDSLEKPFIIKVPYIKRYWLSDLEINENNRKILTNIT